MRLILDTTAALTERLPALREDALRTISRKHVRERRRFLAHLLGASYENRNPHTLYSSAQSFSRTTWSGDFAPPRTTGRMQDTYGRSSPSTRATWATARCEEQLKRNDCIQKCSKQFARCTRATRSCRSYRKTALIQSAESIFH